MASIFKQNMDINEHPNRNNHDLSHKVVGSFGFGYLYPCCTIPVVPGDSFDIETAMSLNLMPLNYPTPTRMRVVVNWFYQKVKNCWPNFPNFVQQLEEHEHPYIDQRVDFFSTGSLADYLDVPSTIVAGNNEPIVYGREFDPSNSLVLADTNSNGFTRPRLSGFRNPNRVVKGYFVDPAFAVQNSPTFADAFSDTFSSSPLPIAPKCACIATYYGSKLPLSPVFVPYRIEVEINFGETIPDTIQVVLCQQRSGDINGSIPTSVHDFELIDSSQLQGNTYSCAYREKREGEFVAAYNSIINGGNFVYVALVSLYVPEGKLLASVPFNNFTMHYDLAGVKDVTAFPNACPWSRENSTPDRIRINAIPFRVYESIYNAYYRNQQGNQPFVVNGQVMYNKYNTTTDDGADVTPYHLFHKNWELDMFTSCLPSPQSGPAPLVGMTALGQLQVEDENGIATFSVDEQGKEISIVATNPLSSVEQGRVAMNVLNAGMSINDFRAGNALQRFFELNLRKGYKYIDFIAGHFGKAPKNAEMDMPEFIGGYSQEIVVQQVTNMSQNDNPEQGLGSYAGQANAFGRNKHGIRRYFDDYGYLMAIVSFIPDPSYSQVLPKHYLTQKPLDYYFPEFAQLGMQPITYEELCPIQSHMEYLSDSSKKLTDTFGYQRPNYDMVQKLDTLHGLFRTDMNDYVVNRVFRDRPELGDEFLTIKREETNSIFQFTKSDDTIVGQIAFKIHAKRPVPRVVIPNLGK